MFHIASPDPGPLVLAARTLIALVLLTAGVAKLREPGAFLGAVHGYRLLPDALVAPFARVLPWIELGLGLLVPTGLAAAPVAIATAGLFLCFAAAMMLNLLRGRRDIDCGCFLGRPAQRLTYGHAGRTLALAAAALLTGVAAPVALGDAAFEDAWQGLTAGAVLFLLQAAAGALPTFERKRPRISL